MLLARAFLGVLLAAALAGCGPKFVRKTVVDDGGVQVILRGETQGGKPVDQGFQQPASISGVRLAHILSTIDIRSEDSKGNDRTPAIPGEILYDVGDALSRALAEADNSQEIVVMAKRRAKRLAIFTDEYLTSFVSFVKDDRLYIYLSRVDWPVPKNTTEKIAEPKVDKPVMKFHVLPSTGLQTAGPQGVAVDWRDPVFKQATAVRVTPTGKIVRRTILMESAPDTPPAGGAEDEPTVSGNLSPETLRKLADLEEARRRGELTEGEYAAKKRSILLADPSATAPPHPTGSPSSPQH